MPFCKKCGSFYTKALGVCPACNAEEQMRKQEEEHAQEKPEKNGSGEIKRRWTGILIFVPAMIAFIYLIIYFTKAW